MFKRAIPGKDGNKYVPFDERSGDNSIGGGKGHRAGLETGSLQYLLGPK